MREGEMRKKSEKKKETRRSSISTSTWLGHTNKARHAVEVVATLNAKGSEIGFYIIAFRPTISQLMWRDALSGEVVAIALFARGTPAGLVVVWRRAMRLQRTVRPERMRLMALACLVVSSILSSLEPRSEDNKLGRGIVETPPTRSQSMWMNVVSCALTMLDRACMSSGRGEPTSSFSFSRRASIVFASPSSGRRDFGPPGNPFIMGLRYPSVV
jgi:hypothetical protein